MHTVLVTGASGFIGKNLCVHLGNRADLTVLTAGRGTSEATLEDAISVADTVIHLAGVNRPLSNSDFDHGNVCYTKMLTKLLASSVRPRRVIFTSSVQAETDSPYGCSKRRAEDCLRELSSSHPMHVSVFRLKNVFGKWCRPNYNSVVATFCHNIANALPIEIHDPHRLLELIFIDDVVRAIERELLLPLDEYSFLFRGNDIPSTTISLGELASQIQSFREMHTNLLIPDCSSKFSHQLYSTYLNYVGPDSAGYRLPARQDTRGSLAEFIKSKTAGQIFVSRTRPGATRGNHFHHTKTEKFLVLEGEGLIQLRELNGQAIVEHRVSGSDYYVVDIPPGYTHSITNVGARDMVTLFWASELFDPNNTDTFPLAVTRQSDSSAPVRGNAA